jgi:hypothetical protein
MGAPRFKVVEKLLVAHKQRSLLMIKQFNIDLLSDNNNNNNNNNNNSVNNSNINNNNNLNIIKVREFHQSLIVGLIEASKGFFFIIFYFSYFLIFIYCLLNIIIMIIKITTILIQ